MRLKKSEVIPKLPHTDPELLVTQYIATRKGDEERGPMIWLNPHEAKIRSLVDGELVWVRGPRGQQLATLQIDERVSKATCIIRDMIGVSLSETVRVYKPDFDSPQKSLA